MQIRMGRVPLTYSAWSNLHRRLPSCTYNRFLLLLLILILIQHLFFCLLQYTRRFFCCRSCYYHVFGFSELFLMTCTLPKADHIFSVSRLFFIDKNLSHPVTRSDTIYFRKKLLYGLTPLDDDVWCRLTAASSAMWSRSNHRHLNLNLQPKFICHFFFVAGTLTVAF